MVYEQQQPERSVGLRQNAQNFSRPRPLVLVIEDSEDDYLLLQRAFSKFNGYAEMTRFQDGGEAIDYLTTAKTDPALLPALLLLDLKLPGLSGFDILKWIRDDSVFKLLVVNVLTSSAEPMDIERAFQLGANAYTVKPMGLNKFEELMSALLKFWLELSQLPACRK
jgi:two-component system response regulator